MLLYYVLITLPCPTIARWTVGFKCCTYCEYKITIMLPSLVQLYTEPSNATAAILVRCHPYISLPIGNDNEVSIAVETKQMYYMQALHIGILYGK